MSDKPITREALANAGGMAFEMEEPRTLDINKCKKNNTWPAEMPEPGNIVFFGTRVYKRTASELAMELGTTPRAISRLRAGRIDEAKPLSWYDENRKGASNSKSTSNRKRSFIPKHLPTGM